MSPPDRGGAGRRARCLQALLLALHAISSGGACYKHADCASCIAEFWQGGSCLWYMGPLSKYGKCLAGVKVPSTPQIKDTGSVSPGAFSVWTGSAGQTWSLYDVDQVSEGSCVQMSCEKAPQCSPGMTLVEDVPCYGATTHPEYRLLKCCRQQRNMDGFLSGFQAFDGVVIGQIFFATCCRSCQPGYTNVACDPPSDGECQLCASGKFNSDGSTGSRCKPCSPCEAGEERKYCVSSQGICSTCEEGYFKLSGLDGSWNQDCSECAACPAGYWRAECGPVSPGHCQSCPAGSWYAQPFCRECSSCSGGIRMGCALRSEGICPECSYGDWEEINTVGLTCRRCAWCPPAVDVTVGGLLLAGEYARVGCGGQARGACARLAAGLGQAPQCPAEGWPTAVCQGASLQVQWAFEGLAAWQLLQADAGNCTAAADLCLAGLWRVTLQRRTVAAPLGEEAQWLGEWWTQDLAPASEGDGGLLFAATLPALDADLPSGGGYFLRVDFIDRGGSCCAASDASPISAFTEDFALADPRAAAEVALEDAALAMAAGDRDGSAASAAAACAGRGAESAAAAGLSLWVACERKKALRLGLMIGQEIAAPAALSLRASQPSAASSLARSPVSEAGEALQEWEGHRDRLLEVLPGTLEQWRAAVGALHNSSGAISSSGQASALLVVKEQAEALAAVVGKIAALWEAEVEAALLPLRRALADIRELDGLLGGVARSVDFDVIRAVQALTWQLRRSFEDGPPQGAQDRQAWLDASFHCIGNTALLLVGAWGSTWKHDMAWDIQASVGGGPGAAWPPVQVERGFGGAAPEAIAVPVEETRARLWDPFRQVAEDWLDMWGSQAAVGRLRRQLAEPRSRRAAATASAELTAAAAGALDCVEAVTEQVLEPLERVGSQLLVGPLPDFAVSSATGRCLRDALDVFSEASAAQDAFLGLGEGKIRPWHSYQAARHRLQNMAAEVVGLARGRLRALDGLLARALDAREVALEPEVARAAAARAQGSAGHLSALAEDPSGTDAAAPWHWLDVKGELLGALGASGLSAARLGHRRWVRLAQLAAWAGAPEGKAFKFPFSLRNSSWQLDAAERAAAGALKDALEDAAGQSAQMGTGYLRVEGAADARPLALAALAESGSAAVRLRGLGGVPVRMHSEALAFLISPASAGSAPLKVDESNAVVAGGAFAGGSSAVPDNSSEPHVEVSLRRLESLPGEPSVEEDAAVFGTRFRRGGCEPLQPAAGGGGLGGALIPLDGVWVVSVRDGASQRQLAVDEGTTLRLLLRIDVPTGEAPFRVVEGPADTVYALPDSGRCDELEALVELPPTPAPTFVPLPTTTSTTTFTTSTSSTTRTSSSPRTTKPFVIPGGRANTQSAEMEEVAEEAPLLFYIVIFVGSLVLCGCCVLGAVQLWKLRQRRRVRSRHKCAIAPAPDEDDASNVPRTGAASGSGLRQRLPSPKSPTGGGSIAALRYAGAPPPYADVPPPPLATLEQPAQEAEPPKLPKLDLKDPAGGKPALAVATPGDDDSWDGSNTPSGETPGGSSSPSSSGTSSRSSISTVELGDGDNAARSASDAAQPPATGHASCGSGSSHGAMAGSAVAGASAAASTCAESSHASTPKDSKRPQSAISLR